MTTSNWPLGLGSLKKELIFLLPVHLFPFGGLGPCSDPEQNLRLVARMSPLFNSRLFLQ